ncbi:2-desacetyl-2-hydroxyethyl bacteriochlorophyllide A dehydrogenase [Trinickia symbiotica]|uniref:Alcohol dehydrogenase n=1 Tax=Trinickia symbiotica TaxID=863227 RepID=A0A2N7X0K7_9BURK|nr:alcohol dehydrogenase catalytic domain-containing protein [Trinickia symbiotica]PMS35154.1 alcohol dehydrogenase [Trinickia symbiotica]PPK43706.1 2-desacetyl-2-hydroxyethyl bacteriochlorophyllide A dehydrogenase [Trinickia symbiotica]
MRAVRIESNHKIDVIELPAPIAKDREIVVRPVACGICGTDLHICQHGFPGTNYPVTPGHEFAGHVVAAGREVKGIKEGDFVAVNPNVSCGACEWCKEGKPHLCNALTPIGVGRPGAAAEQVVVPGQNAHVVRESIGYGVAALIEPLACALHAVESSQGVRDRRVLVIGAGTMGLLTSIIARHHGAAEVTVIDPNQGKHPIAVDVGAHKVATPEQLGDERYEVVFEAAGAMPALRMALNHIRKTGVLVQVGVHNVEAIVEVNPFTIYEHELRIIGSNSLANQFPAAVDLMYDIAQPAGKLIGETYSVWDFGAAVQKMASSSAVKTQLRFD